ncbi:MAG TPA: hypothetical protein VFN21_01790 [Acidimicrobiales bacterium]|nr:hypothetical protein [Acidimicrobiales bacterium]
MATYEPAVYVDPLGYQPVEFLDIPPMRESRPRRESRDPEATVTGDSRPVDEPT